MSQTFHKVWVHLVWGTKNSQPYLNEEIRQRVLDHMREKAQSEGYRLDIINGRADHIHCLVSLEPRMPISEVVNVLKGESSHWINSEKLTKTHFAWQGGFGAFSVSESLVERVRRYIATQDSHHRQRSFTEEVEEFLKRHNAVQADDAKGCERPLRQMTFPRKPDR